MAAAKPADKPGGSRRAFLGGSVGAGLIGAAAAGFALRDPAPALASTVAQAQLTGRLPAVPFHGRYQAGIVPSPSPATAVVAFDVTAQNRAELTDLLRAITDRARFLTAGGVPAPVGISAPSSDSGVLGPTVVPDGLTVTLGVGESLFDDRFGLAAASRRSSPRCSRSLTTRWTRPSATAT